MHAMNICPNWFSDIDMVFSFISLIVVFVIALYARKIYKTTQTQSSKHFMYAYYVLTLAFFFKVLTSFTYFHPDNALMIGSAGLSCTTPMVNSGLFVAGLFIFKLLTLAGYYYIIRIIDKNEKITAPFEVLIMFFIFTTVVFSMISDFVFQIAALLMALIISWTYLVNYNQKHNKNTRNVMITFFILAISHFIFLFMTMGSLIYVIAQSVQVIAFIYLFITFFRVLSYGKKK